MTRKSYFFKEIVLFLKFFDRNPGQQGGVPAVQVVTIRRATAEARRGSRQNLQLSPVRSRRQRPECTAKRGHFPFSISPTLIMHAIEYETQTESFYHMRDERNSYCVSNVIANNKLIVMCVLCCVLQLNILYITLKIFNFLNVCEIIRY